MRGVREGERREGREGGREGRDDYYTYYYYGTIYSVYRPTMKNCITGMDTTCLYNQLLAGYLG